MLRILGAVAVLVVGGAIATTRVLGSDSGAALTARSTTTSTPVPVTTPATSNGQADPNALLASLLVTYAPGSPCASVKVTTPISRVPSACAAAWAPYSVSLVPGQDAMTRTPRFPQVSAGPGVSAQEAMTMAIALWRTKTFQAYALSTRQLPIEAGLGPNSIFLQAGSEEHYVEQGDRVTTPLCHFFASQIRVVTVAPDFAGFVHRSGRVLGVKARFLGPCYATAIDSHGAKHQIFSFDGADDAVFVGDIGTRDPLGGVLYVTGIGDCSAAVVKATCAI